MRVTRASASAVAGIVSIGAVVQATGLLTASRAAAAGATAAARSSISFSRGLTLLDNTGASTGAAEPSIKVDSGGRVYVTGPAGVPTGGCPLWRIHPDTLNAQKHAYDYLGKFDTDHQAPGGGDCDLATGGKAPQNGVDNLAATSLSLASITANQSSNGGTTFHTPANPIGNQTPGDDRQWNAADTTLGQVYTIVHDVSTDNIQFASSTDGGYVYTSNTPAIQTTPGSCGQPGGCFSVATQDNHFGPLVVNTTTHMLYTVYIAPATAAELAAAQQQGANPNEHVVYLAVGNPCAVTCVAGQPLGPITWKDYPVYNGPTGTDLGHVFPSIAIDAAGAVYMTWSDTHRVYLTRSTHPNTIPTTFPSSGSTAGWSTPAPVSSSGLHSAMMPWIIGGRPGVVDMAWYAATLNATNPACNGTEPVDDTSGVNNNCHDQWDVDFVQATYGSGGKPVQVQSDIQSKPVHNGSLCDQGLNCSIFGGDRTLLDYFEIALDPLGAANIAFASDYTTPGQAQIIYSRQCSGPSATSARSIAYPCGALQPGPPPVPASVCSGTNVVTDPSGDAVNPTTGGSDATTPQADITGVSFSATATTLTTTMTIATLTTPPVPLAGTSDTYYYVAWSYGGNTYATLASEPQPNSTAFSYGIFNPSTNQLTTTNAASGSVVAGTPGTISVTVPLSAIGNPVFPSSTLTGAGVVNPYAYVFSGEGAAATGVIFTHPDDRAPNAGYGPAWEVC